MPDGTVILNGGRSRRGKVRGPPGSKEWSSALKGCEDSLFIDFLRRCLVWDPNERMTPAQVRNWHYVIVSLRNCFIT